MKRLTPLLVVAVTGTAQAGFESMMNPMAMMNPAATMNPMGMVAPLGMMAAPLGMGMMNPMGMGTPMTGLGALYPVMQLAPSLLSFGHLNSMTNPYLGGPFQGNPYLQRGMPWSSGGWGGPQQMAPASQMPFSFPMMAPQQAPQPASPGAFPFAMMAPPQSAPTAPPAAFPYPMPQPVPAPAAQAPASTASGTSPMLFDPAVWLNMMNQPQTPPAAR